MVFCGGNVCRIQFSVPKEAKSERLIRKGIRNDKKYSTSRIVALPGHVINAFCFISDRKTSFFRLGETDHAGDNGYLVCQRPGMDVEGRGPVAIRRILRTKSF
jgi:hypothetical protein